MKALALPALVAVLVAAAGAALTQEPAPAADRLLSEARVASYRIRTGRYELAAASAAALEAGTQAHPQDGRLWNALGVAYFQQVTAAVNAGAFKDIPALIGRARDAHAKALALDPNDPEALSGHGTALAIIAQFTRRPELGQEGMAELDRAVALDPGRTVVRLQRGFTNLGVPPPMGSMAAAEADLKHLLTLAERTQPGDVLHVLLGDLYAQDGRAELAKAEYRAAGRPASKVRDMAQARLDALAQGAPPTGDIGRLRNDIARNCVMCHGG